MADYHLDINHPFYLHLRSLFKDLEQASVHARGRLLDIGCGNKPYEKMFTGRVTEHIGCDVIQSSGNRVDVICPANAIPLKDKTFNTVLCTQVIEHVADHRGLLQEAFRLLDSKGILILSGPMYWPLHEEPYDFFRFTEHGFRYLLEGLGFTVIKIQGNGGKWALCGQAIVHSIQNTRWEKPFIIRIINRIFARMDDRNQNRGNPINYIVVAQKP